MIQAARTLFLKRPIANMLFGLIVASFAAQGSYAFVPAYFSRAFDLDYATIGVISAVTGGATVGLGLAAGGVLADALGARDAKWYALVPAGGLIIALPLYVLAFLQADWRMSALFLGAAGFFQYLSFGPTVGVVQNIVDSRRRATATALVFILLTVICLGFGPPFTGWLIDRFAELNFSALRLDGSFNLICGSGKAATTATAALKQRMRIHACPVVAARHHRDRCFSMPGRQFTISWELSAYPSKCAAQRCGLPSDFDRLVCARRRG